MKRRSDPFSEFSLSHFFEDLQAHSDFACKKMFGGLAIYWRGKMVGCLMESTGNKTYRRKRFPFEIWNGILLPTEFVYHENLQAEFPELLKHPVLAKWLYLPMSAADFESSAQAIVSKIQVGDERFGIWPGLRKKKPKAKPKRRPRKLTKASKSR